MSRILLVFAKAPEPGRVKTRLARGLGREEAARIYEEMGREIVHRLTGGAYRVVIYFDPPEAERAVRSWLGEEGMEFLPQPGGGLGERLLHAFEWGFRRAERVCVVGTDIPDLHSSVVETAFEAVEGPAAADAYFGPATDGGYYLLALGRPHPPLFRDIPWSTAQVLPTSLDRAEAGNLRVELGPELADVDHPADLPDRFLGKARDTPTDG